MSPLIGSRRTSTVSVIPATVSPITSEAFSAWVVAAAPPSCDALHRDAPSVESEETLTEDAESQFTLTESVESQHTGSEEATSAEASSSGHSDAGDHFDSFPELHEAETAAQILYSHASSTANVHVEEAMQCLSSAHTAMATVLTDSANQIKKLQARSEKKSRRHAAQIEELNQQHERAVALLRQQLDEKRPAGESDVSGGKCVLCLDGAASHAAVPCGHLAFCGVCAAERPSAICPVCRHPSQCFIRIFKP